MMINSSILGLTLGALLSRSAFTSEFVVTGECSRSSRLEMNNGNTNVTHRWTGEFRLRFLDCDHWNIRYQPRSGPGAEENYREIGYDGRRLYAVKSWEKKVEQDVRSGQKRPLNIGEARIQIGQVPTGDVEARVIWLAFIAQCFLPKNNGDMKPMLPFAGSYSTIESIYFQHQNVQIPGRWAFHREAPGVLEFLTEWSDGNSHLYKGEEEEGLIPPHKIPLPAPYDSGFTNAIYTTEGEVGIEGYRVPRTCTYVHFIPLLGREYRPGKPVYESDRFELTVAGVTATDTTAASMIPELPGNCLFVDSRFMLSIPRVFGINYFTNRFLSDEEVRGLKEYAYQLRQVSAAPLRVSLLPAKSPLNVRLRRALVYSGFALAFLICLVLVSKAVSKNINNAGKKV